MSWLLALSWLTATPPARAESAGETSIALLTFGPGDHPFSKFGHTALLVDDGATKLVYNYGTFTFDSLWLIPKFLVGKYRYWLSVQRLERTVAIYAAENRSVDITPLSLTPEQKREVLAFLRWNARDENKYYVFDYYRDNCATRVRDILDKAYGGALRSSAQGPATMTWRQHTMRLSADTWWVYAGLYVAMGPLIDAPITRWDEMFLPSKLEQGTNDMLRAAALLPEADPAVLVRSDRPAVRSRPPQWTARIAAAASAAGGCLVLLGAWAGRGHRGAGRALALISSVLGLSLGALGVLFVFLWTCTNHAVAYRNENILQCAPWALWLVLAGYRCVRERPGAEASLLRAASVMWATALVGVALKLTPYAVQENGQVVALTLPIWSGLTLAAYLGTIKVPREVGARGRSPRRGTLPTRPPETSASHPASPTGSLPHRKGANPPRSC